MRRSDVNAFGVPHSHTDGCSTVNEPLDDTTTQKAGSAEDGDLGGHVLLPCSNSWIRRSVSDWLINEVTNQMRSLSVRFGRSRRFATLIIAAALWRHGNLRRCEVEVVDRDRDLRGSGSLEGNAGTEDARRDNPRYPPTLFFAGEKPWAAGRLAPAQLHASILPK